MTWTPPVREDLQGQKPYGAPQLDVPVRLNTNENPFPPSAALAEAVGRAAAAAATSLNRYPDREAWALRESLAAYLLAESGVAVDPAMVWAANGSNEVMQHVFAAFGGPGRLAMGFSPTYSMYDQYARDTFTRYRTVGRRADFGPDAAMVVAAMTGGSPDILILTSPNNPTGQLLDEQAVLGLAQALLGRAVVVVDEAYVEFADRPSLIGQLERTPNLVILRTLSKAYALAGARLGAMVASREITDLFRRIVPPYALATPVLEAADALLDVQSLQSVEKRIKQVRQLREDLAAELATIRTVRKVWPSDANFLLVSLDNAAGVSAACASRGILVRDFSRHPDLPDCLRFTIGTPEEQSALLACIREQANG